jgi:hypothetical protein
VAKLTWDSVTKYADGVAIPAGTTLGYKVYWKTSTTGYNSADVMDVVGAVELDLSFLPAKQYQLAVSCYAGSLESVRSLDLPFLGVPPAAPSGLRIL